MDLRATKTHGERQDEEAERLVRPAPKLKPPRHDRRRERVQVDSDEEEDKDLSLNFKTIGGSLQERISWRYMIAAPKAPKIKVRHRETGKVVNVTEDTLKAEPGKYEKIEESEDNQDSKSFERGEALRSLTKTDSQLEGAFKSLLNPKSDLGGLAEANPSLPAKSVFKTVPLPEGVETIGDMVEALRSKAPKVKPAEGKPKLETTPVEMPMEEAKKERPDQKPAAPLPAEAPAEGSLKEEAKASEEGQAPEEGGPAESKMPAESESAPESPEAEKAGIPPAKRRAVSEDERMEAASLIMDTFPDDVATELLARNLHPDDVSSLVDSYHTSKSLPLKGSSPSEFAENASSFYELNPDRVKPPKTGKNAEGKIVAFDELAPDEKAEATRQHQMRVVAMSLAAKDVLTRELSMPSFTGKPQIPQDLAATVATFMLRKGGEKAGKRLSEKIFQSALESGTGLNNEDGTPARPMKPEAIQGFLKHLSPGAKALAAGYLQARDYHLAKSHFLGMGDEHISERSRPRDIFAAMKRAKDYFEGRAKVYGVEGSHRAQSTFQVRLLSKLRALAPDSYRGVRQLMATDQKESYDREKAKFEKDLKGWEERKKAWDAQQPAYRGKPFSEPRPEEPRKPPLYHLAVDPKQARRDAKQMWEDAKAQNVSADVKMKAASILRRFTYPCAQTMGQGSDKTGVYHGVDPKAQYPVTYPGWQQGHQRDFDRADFEAILGAARSWLKAPVLSTAVEGVVPDQQFRAALDLAIRDSKFDGQVQPGVYNELLAKLAGEPKPGLGQTRMTVREGRDSSFGLDKKGTPMKVSRELRALAAKVASTDIAAASEMIALAEELETVRLAAGKWTQKDNTWKLDGKGEIETAAVEEIKGPGIPLFVVKLTVKGKGQYQARKEFKKLTDAQKAAETWVQSDAEGASLVLTDFKKTAGSTDERFTKLKNLVIRTAAADAEAKKVLLPVLQEIKNLG